MESSNENARVNAVIYGRVQGVGYRFFAQRVASTRGVRGFVRNTPDGSVEVVAEGPRAVLEGFVDSLRQGPPGARVERVQAVWSTAEGGFSGFRIRH